MLAVLSSITTAGRIKRMLESQNVRADIVQTPKSISGNSCGYSLRVQERDIDLVNTCAKNLGVLIKGFYDEKLLKANRPYPIRELRR